VVSVSAWESARGPEASAPVPALVRGLVPASVRGLGQVWAPELEEGSVLALDLPQPTALREPRPRQS
jgi:hypothetical protein